MVDSPQFVRDNLPPEASLGQKFLQETARRACRKYARVRSATAGIAYAPVYSNLCDPYLSSINEGPQNSGNNAPPFTGGQCSGVLYQMYYRPLIQAATGLRVAGFKYPFEYGASGTYGVAAQFGPFTYAGQTNYIESTYPDGSKASITNYGIKRGSNVFFSWVVGSNIQIENHPDNPDPKVGFPPSAIDIEFVPVDSSQECGNPPTVYIPPQYPPGLPPLSPPSNPAPGGGNNWDVNILPDGQINICIGGECSGGTPPDGGGGPDSGGGPGEPDGDPQETDPNDPDNPNEVSGCVEDGNVLTGVQIDIIQEPPNYQGLGTIYYRSCWVWMGPSSGLLDMVSDGKAIESGQFVIPDSRDCVCYKVRANPGFRVSVQAYSRPKEE